jgi:hypothetical protein
MSERTLPGRLPVGFGNLQALGPRLYFERLSVPRFVLWANRMAIPVEFDRKSEQKSAYHKQDDAFFFFG